MSIMQQFGDDERGRSLQRALQRRSGASRSSGDEANRRTYGTMRYVEGERSQGRRASYEQGGRFPSNHLGERMYAQEASEIRSDDKGTFVWYAGDRDGLGSGASDQEWKSAGAVKVYGDFSKYTFPERLGLDDMIVDKHDYIIRPTGDGSYELDEEQTQAQAGMEKGYSMAEEVQYDDRGTTKDLLARLNAVNKPLRGRMEGDRTQYLPNPGRAERKMAGEARGGMGASATEDLLERLNQYKRNAQRN